MQINYDKKCFVSIWFFKVVLIKIYKILLRKKYLDRRSVQTNYKKSAQLINLMCSSKPFNFVWNICLYLCYIPRKLHALISKEQLTFLIFIQNYLFTLSLLLSAVGNLIVTPPQSSIIECINLPPVPIKKL